jgi:hypothetical protein
VVVVVESAEHWNYHDRPGVMGGAMDWRVFVQSRRGVRYIRFAKATGRDGPIADSCCGEPLPDDVPIDGVAVAEQVLRCLLPGKGFGDLPRNPFGRGCERHCEDTPAIMVQDRERIEAPETDCRHNEQIHRGDSGVVAEEGLPVLARWRQPRTM